jgi:hypothetical protein
VAATRRWRWADGHRRHRIIPTIGVSTLNWPLLLLLYYIQPFSIT